MDDAFALLRLQIDWGADEALDADPLDRLRAVDPLPAPAGAGVQRAAPRVVAAAPATIGPQSRVAAAERALAIAGQAATLDALREAIAGFDGCALRDTASNTVWAEGARDSAVLIVGETPGRDEDRTGHPFAGNDGALLDQMLASIGVTREDVMLTPLLPWRPPGGRPPSAAELAVCLPFLHRLIVLQQPERLVIFGNTAARTLLPSAAARRRAVPVWVEASMPGLPKAPAVLVLPSLAEMQRTPAVRRTAWAGLRLLRRALDLA